MGKSKSLRLTLEFFLLAFILAMSLDFLFHLRKRPEVIHPPDKIPSQKVEMKRKIEHLELRGERGNVRVRADKQYMGEDFLYHLEGNVEVVFLKKREGKDVILQGDEVIYDKNWDEFSIRGSAKISHKDITVKSSTLVYNTIAEVLRTEEKVEFSSSRLSGSGKGMFYIVQKDKLELLKDVRLQVKPKLETSLPLLIESQGVKYFREEKRGILEGQVNLSQEESHASAEKIWFELDEDEEQIKSLTLKGRAKARLIEKEKEEEIPSSQAFTLLKSSQKEVEGERVELRGYEGLTAIQSVHAKGGSLAKFASSSGAYTLIKAEAIHFLLRSDGTLEEFQASGKSQIIEEKGLPTEQIRGEGNNMFIGKGSKLLEIRGGKRFKAKIILGVNEILAEKISLNLDTQDVEAKSSVEMTRREKQKEEPSLVFFENKNPTFLTAEEVRYSKAKKRFFVRGKVKMWQEKKSLQAEEVTLFEETGEAHCKSNVNSSLPSPRKDKEEEEERIEISSQKMNFIPAENLISYEEQGTLRIKDIILNSPSLLIHLDPETREIEKIEAKGDTTITQGSREAIGKKALYEPRKETMVLLGNPVLIDKDKGKVEGDKLTFHLSDGRIVVENKGKERSIILIKS